jgi:hypothetical protein
MADGRDKTLYNASLPFVDVQIVRTEVSNYFSLSYCGSKGCEIACAHFSFDNRLERLETLYMKASLSFLSGWVDPIISFDGFKRDGGCELAACKCLIGFFNYNASGRNQLLKKLCWIQRVG